MAKKRISFELLLLFSVFVIATCGLVYELVAGALASYLLGDSVKQFSFIIGVYLFSMGVGSYLAKFIKENYIMKYSLKALPCCIVWFRIMYELMTKDFEKDYKLD